MRTIEISREGGSLSGYAVDATEQNIGNYLEQHSNLAEMVSHRLRAYGDRVALLRNMSVDDDQRGKGIGTQLISEFMEEADDAGATVYMLICDVKGRCRASISRHGTSRSASSLRWIPAKAR